MSSLARLGPKIFLTAHPLTKLFASLRHVFAQDLVHAGLPALPLAPVGLKHIGVEPQRLVHLPLELWRAATAAQRFGGLRTEYFADDFQGRPRVAKILCRPFGIVVVRPRGRRILVLAYIASLPVGSLSES